MESHRELSASLLVIFLVTVWSLLGPLCKLWSIQSGDDPEGRHTSLSWLFIWKVMLLLTLQGRAGAIFMRD